MPIRAENQWKPSQGTPVAAGGLAAGLVGLWPLNEGGGSPCDAASGTVASSNSAAWVGSPSGAALGFNGTTQSVNCGANPAWSITGPFSVAFLGNPAVGVAQNVVEFRTTGNTGGFSLIATSASLISLITGNGGTVRSAPSSASAVDGGWHLFSASMASTGSGGATIYRDGVPWGTGLIGAFPGPNGVNYHLGVNPGGTAAFLNGSLALVAIWGRALSDQEHAALARNPWQLFAPRRYYSLLRAAAPPPGAVKARRTSSDRVGTRGVA